MRSFARINILRLLLIPLVTMIGCQHRTVDYDAMHAYYGYDFTRAREILRGRSILENDEQTLLHNAQVGVAALADGDVQEADRAFARCFALLNTPGLNEQRDAAVILTTEGVRIWKGQPYEQAMLFQEIANYYATIGDWENARAAATNALFRLTEFRESAQAGGDAEGNVDAAVKPDFPLALLMAGAASNLSNTAGGSQQLDAAVASNPALEPIVDRLRDGSFDTLLIVDYGEGPIKIPYGPDGARAHFEPQHGPGGPLIVTADGSTLIEAPIACNVNELARKYTWDHLEDLRVGKSVVGEGLIIGGTVVAATSDGDSWEQLLAGLGMIVTGALARSGAQADMRQLAVLPQSVYFAPVMLGQRSDVHVQVQGDPLANVVLPDVEPGTPQNPRVAYLRLMGESGPPCEWLTKDEILYGNDVTGVRAGDYPWILGGMDVSTPTRQTLEAYQRNGYLLDYTLDDLLELYRAEDILIGQGMENRPDRLRNPSFRHVLEGGSGLFTPQAWSMGYKRIMSVQHPPYRPKSEFVRNAAAAIGVNER